MLRNSVRDSTFFGLFLSAPLRVRGGGASAHSALHFCAIYEGCGAVFAQRQCHADFACPLSCEFVARIGRLACGDGWRRRTTPSVTLDPPCRSKPMLIAVTISPNSGAG